MTNLDLIHTLKQDSAKTAEDSPLPRPAVQLVPFSTRYRIEAPLGHSTGSIFRAKDLKTGISYAIKRLPQDAALEPGEYDRFVSEVTLLSQLCPPNIVTMKELHRDDAGRCCLVMDLLEGEDALTHLSGGQRLSLPRVLEITRQVASALHCAHLAGIAHREFALSSIFLAMQRGLCGRSREVVKVVGFGGVKLRTLPGRRAQHGIQGTVAYLAPEAISGPLSALDARSDQWSVAVAVYRMLSGRQPFQADDEASLRHQICSLPPAPLNGLCPELPPHVVETIERAMSKDKAQRFPSMAEFMRALSGQMSPRAAESGQPVALALPAKAPPAEVAPECVGIPSCKPHEPASGARKRRPISVSEVPTISMVGDPARTQKIDPEILDQLRVQSSEQPGLKPSQPARLEPADLEAVMPPRPIPPLPETLPGAWLMARGRRETLRQTLVLVLGSCIGLSLGMSAAWQLGFRPNSHLPQKALPVIAPSERLQQPSLAAATTKPRIPWLASRAGIAGLAIVASIDRERPYYFGPCYGDESQTIFVSSALSHSCISFRSFLNQHPIGRWTKP